jgi:hypothetical protein
MRHWHRQFEIISDAPRVLDSLCDEVRAGVDGDKLLAQARVILQRVTRNEVRRDAGSARYGTVLADVRDADA